MKIERWQKIEELFNATLALPVEQREEFLRVASDADVELRMEVDSLIGLAEEDPDDFLGQSVLTLGTRLLANEQTESLSGKTFGPYTVLRPVGRGGMGEVYLALDGRLGRKVAIKLLPVSLVQHEERVRRFEREARAASAISHANVAHIYEIGEDNGRLYMAMEFVDGVTLRERFCRGAMRLGEAIDIATQVVSAIEAAHAEGVVHRDIKPENIIIRHDGLAKVVDFGIAKLTEPQRTLRDGESRETQPGVRVMHTVHTEPGLVMGTANYMSPEQARGQDVDVRTDIWSLGVLFYEMLAGEPPFGGATNNDVIAEILKGDPPLLENELSALPMLATEILRRTLSKDKEARYAKASELAAALSELRQQLEPSGLLEMQTPLTPVENQTRRGELAIGLSHDLDQQSKPHPEIATPPSLTTASATARDNVLGVRSRKMIFSPLFISTAGVITVALVLVFYGLIRRRAASQTRPPLQIVHLTNDGKVMDAAISPDGRLLAYTPTQAGTESLWIQNLESGEKRQLLPSGRADYWGMRFSPNGQSLFYVTKQPDSTINVLYRVPVAGGASQKIIVNTDSAPGLSPDGVKIAFIRSYPGQHRDALIVSNVDGSGERELASRAQPDRFSFASPAWSPDARIIAVGASRADDNKATVLGVPSNGGSPVPLAPWQWATVHGIVWKNSGSSLILTARPPGTRLQMWQVSYPEGTAHFITGGDREYEDITLTQDDRVLVCTDTHEISNIWANDVSGIPRALTSEGREGSDGLAAVPGGQAVYTEGEGEDSHLWSLSLNSGSRKLLTANSGFLPSASRTAKVIAYVSTSGGRSHIWVVEADGSNNRQLTSGEGERYPCMMPDGNSVLYVAQGRIWKIPTNGGKSSQLTHGGIFVRPVVSPDSTKIASTYRSDETDKWKLAILAFKDGQIEKTFSLPNPYQQIVRWSHDSTAITYLNEHDGVYNLWQQPLEGSPARMITNFNDDSIFHYDIWPDNQQMVFSRGGRRTDVVMIKNIDAL